MCILARLLFALICFVGFAGSVRAAAFDFNFLASGVSVGEGSFSFPDADLSQPSVNSTEFTSFDLMAGGHTYTLTDLYYATFNAVYILDTNSFEYVSNYRDSGIYIAGNRITSPDGVPFSFIVGGSYFDPCYYLNECGSNYPDVFAGYSIMTLATTLDAMGNTLFHTDYSASFDTLLITPDTLVPEPSTIALFLTSVGGIGFLARTVRRRRPDCSVDRLRHNLR